MILLSGLCELRSIWKDRRGVSNAIVVVLGLVIVVVIVADVFLWNYEMNQLDWEKAQEDIEIADVSSVNITYSPWFSAQREYSLNTGSRVGGTYIDTQVADDGDWETFREEPRPPLHRLDLNGTFVLDVSAFPLDSISTVEMSLRYMATDLHEDWFLQAYNWTAEAYDDGGFNVTVGHTPTGGWDTYAVNLTDAWRSYVRDDGTMYTKVRDEGNDAPQTTIDIDFLGVRAVAGGTRFLFENGGPVTCHLVSLWIINSTLHRRYDMSVFVNSGETTPYLRADISLPKSQSIVKVVTERGNTSVYSIE